MNTSSSHTPDLLSKKQGNTGAAFRPLYKQIKELLVHNLEAGEWKPGESIPSELELAAKFQVSQGTVRKAIDELAAESVLLRRQGKGTFVATHHEAEVRFRFLRLFDGKGTKAKRAESKFLSCIQKKPSTQEIELLELSDQEDVLAIRRLMSFDGQVTVLEDIILPTSVFSGLSLQVLNQNKGPLYGFFETQFGVSMIRASEQIRAVAAAPDEAKLLAVDEGFPLLSVKRTAFTYGDKPMEIRTGLYITEHYFYRNSLN